MGVLRTYRFTFALVGIFVFVFALLHYFYFQKIGAFGCFDDCPNIMAGYFMTKGRVLYSEIFYNHQPLITYFSAWIQQATNPQTIYQLIVYHRLFVYAASFLFAILLIVRFGYRGFFIAVLLESTKFFFFGDRFLAEGLIVYPLVYLFLLVWEHFKKKPISRRDVVFSGLLTWFVVFLREPYIPLALFLFGIVLFYANKMRDRLFSTGLFVVLSTITILQFPFADYYFSVVTVNQSFHLQSAFGPPQLFKSLLYPLYIFIAGKLTPLHVFLIVSSIIFFVFAFLFYKRTKHVLPLLFVFVTLFLANLRPEIPGLMFYESFHMLVWFGLFIASIIVLTPRFALSKFSLPLLPLSLIAAALLYLLASSGSHLRDRSDPQNLFFTGYNQYYTAGEMVRRLSSDSDTLFLDGWNDLIYFQAGIASDYKYSWYTGLMTGFERYTSARSEFLRKNPPTFFYGACEEWPMSEVSLDFLNSYDQFYFDDEPTCLYIAKTKAQTLTEEQRVFPMTLGYELVTR